MLKREENTRETDFVEKKQHEHFFSGGKKMRNAIATSKVKMSSSAEKKVNMTTSETFFW